MKRLIGVLLIAGMLVGLTASAAATSHQGPPDKVNCVNYQAQENSQADKSKVFQLPLHAAEKVNAMNKNVACRVPAPDLG